MENAIVAGNGPSLKEIDYSLIPQDFDVFRCNQFYFEEQYFLGKVVKATTFAMQTAFEQIYTMLHLNQNQEYEVQSIFLRDLHYPNQNYEQKEFGSLTRYFDNHHFIHRIYDGIYSHKINAFLEYTKIQELYFYKHASSGVLLCAIAVAMGYKKIHLAGIDFYESRSYAFDTLKKNLLKLTPCLPAFMQYSGPLTHSWHSKEADLDALNFLSQQYGVEFYSLCPTSPMSKYFPLSMPNPKQTFTPQNKTKNYTKDILLPPTHAYEKLKKKNVLGGGGHNSQDFRKKQRLSFKSSQRGKSKIEERINPYSSMSRPYSNTSIFFEKIHNIRFFSSSIVHPWTPHRHPLHT